MQDSVFVSTVGSENFYEFPISILDNDDSLLGIAARMNGNYPTFLILDCISDRELYALHYLYIMRDLDYTYFLRADALSRSELFDLFETMCIQCDDESVFSPDKKRRKF